MPEDTPTKKVIELQNSGRSNTEIIQSLQGEGYSFQQISEALNQSQAKASVETMRPNKKIEKNPSEMRPSVIYSEQDELAEEPEAPAPSMMQNNPMNQLSGTYEPQTWPEPDPMSFTTPSMGATSEDIEEIAESIIHEKWQKLTEEFGDIMSWKDKIANDVESIKQELMRVENRFENLQNSVIGKVKEYDQSVTDVSVEIKALGKLLSNIISPLTNNVKELQSIVKNLKD